ncbi:hypothetical protein GQ457_15G018620 [Hibiscus cannabinus]
MHAVFEDNLLPRKDSCDDDGVGILKSNGGEPSSKVNEIPTKEAQDPPLEALKDMSFEEREVTYPRELNYVKGGEILDDPSKGFFKPFNYATDLSHIIVKEGIDCSLDLECPLTDPINAKSLRKSKFQLVDGEWILDLNSQEGDGDEAQVPPMVAPSMAPQVSVDLIQGLFHDLNANINSRFNSMEARMSAFETRFKNQEDRITNIETQFKSQDDHLTRMEMSLDSFHLEWRTQHFPPTNDHVDDDD